MSMCLVRSMDDSVHVSNARLTSTEAKVWIASNAEGPTLLVIVLKALGSSAWQEQKDKPRVSLLWKHHFIRESRKGLQDQCFEQ